MIARGWYEIRWWFWFLRAPHEFPAWMYDAPYHLDRESRREIRNRLIQRWEAANPEPSFRGTYPNRKIGGA